jgi:phosphatidate cytidylyltransferase
VVALVFTALLVASAWFEVRHHYTGCAYFFAGGDRVIGWPYEGGVEPFRLVIVGLIFTAFLAEIISVERPGGDTGRAAASAAWTILAALTMGLLGAFLAKVRFFSIEPAQGLMCLALLLGTVKMGDIGAYAVGSTMGRHKLVPRLSPKKTVEGLLGGLAAGTLAAILIGCLWGHFALWQMLVFGLIVSAAGIMGDLAESLLKRACGVKDSGPIPGFGGALDILDSILAAAPVAYLVLVVLTARAQ